MQDAEEVVIVAKVEKIVWMSSWNVFCIDRKTKSKMFRQFPVQANVSFR